MTQPTIDENGYFGTDRQRLFITDWRNEIITTEKTKMYIVRSLSMANWLCSNGHQILKVEDSEKDSRFKVFLFKDTAALHKTMKQFPKGV